MQKSVGGVQARSFSKASSTPRRRVIRGVSSLGVLKYLFPDAEQGAESNLRAAKEDTDGE